MNENLQGVLEARRDVVKWLSLLKGRLATAAETGEASQELVKCLASFAMHEVTLREQLGTLPEKETTNEKP